MIQTLHLVVMDISGYTDFIRANKTALIHAAEVIAQLLEQMAESTSHPLQLNKFEGDAMLLFAPAQSHDNAGFISVWEQVKLLLEQFPAMRDHLAGGRQACPCAACQSVSQLQLKAFLHHGEADIRRIRGFEELTGEALILIHRLIKNSVQSRHYALLTQEFYRGLGTSAPATQPHRERYSDVGVLDLQLWQLEPEQGGPAPKPVPKWAFWRR